MAEPGALDRLPPEARFAVRALAAGLPLDPVASLLRVDDATVRKHLRTVVRGTGGTPPPPSEGDAALLAALAPALDLARQPPGIPPATPCLEPDVAAAFAAGALDGPLLLAEAEHAADCPACLARVVDLRRSGAAAVPALPATPVPARGAWWPIVLGAAVGLAAGAWYLLL